MVLIHTSHNAMHQIALQTCCFGDNVLCAVHDREVGPLTVADAVQCCQLVLLLWLLAWFAGADSHVGHDLGHPLQHSFVHMPTDAWHWLQCMPYHVPNFWSGLHSNIVLAKDRIPHLLGHGLVGPGLPYRAKLFGPFLAVLGNGKNVS